MFQDLKRLSKETAVYGLSTICGRFLNFFLLPIYTHTLSPADYGIVASMFAYLAFLNVVYGYGMDFAFMRYSKPKNPDDPCFSTAFYSHLITSLVLSALIYKFAVPISILGAIPKELAVITRYAALILALDTLCLVPFAQLRLSHNANFYAGVKILNIVLNLGLNYMFLVRWHQGVQGVFLATVFTSLVTFLILMPYLISKLRLVFNRDLYSELLRFSLPIIPAGLASMAVQVIDRPILMFLTDDKTVGLYQANYRLGAVMMLVVSMFDAAWRPFFLEKAEDARGKALFSRVLTYFIVITSFLWLAMTFFVFPVISFPIFGGKPLIHPAYWVGLSIVPVVALGYVCNGIYINLLAPVTLAKRTDLVAYATAIGAIVNVAAIFALTPLWGGMMGAAVATLIAYAVMAISLYFMGQRIYHIDYEIKRLLHAVLCVAVVIVAARWCGIHVSSGPFWPRLVLLAAFPALLAVSGFFAEDEIAFLKRRLL